MIKLAKEKKPKLLTIDKNSKLVTIYSVMP